MTTYTSLHRHRHEHAPLFQFMMDHFQRSEQIVLHYVNRPCTPVPWCLVPWIHISMMRCAEDCADALLFVHVAQNPFPRLPSRIVECSPCKLVIKGKMIFTSREKPEPFKLTLRPNTNDDGCWWTASLKLPLSAHKSDNIQLLHESNYGPERVFRRIAYRDESIQKTTTLLYQPSDPKLGNDLGLFLEWHPVYHCLLFLSSSTAIQQYIHVNECFELSYTPMTSTPYPNPLDINRSAHVWRHAW